MIQNRVRVALLFGCISLPCLCALQGQAPKPSSALKGTITISGAWALYPMAIRWAEEFMKLNPALRIDIAAGGAGKGVADALGKIVDLGMVSRAIMPEEFSKGVWEISVVRDAVVPVVNAANPHLNQLLTKGVKRDALLGIWISDTAKTWADLTGGKAPQPVNIFTRSDACGAAPTRAAWLGKTQEDLQGIGVYGDPGLAEAVARDVYGIGYNNINFAYDATTKKPCRGIVVLPLDFNNNGALDSAENFYASRDQIIAAIGDGRYPAPPARDLHFVAAGKPQRTEVAAFVVWVLNEGQAFVDECGYIALTAEKLAQQRAKLNPEPRK
jgi:phosphate transport system substrate-binding protein